MLSASPTVAALNQVFLTKAGHYEGRGLMISLCLERATVRTRIPAHCGDVLIGLGRFDGKSVLFAAVVREVVSSAIVLDFAAMQPESRANLTRFLYSRLAAKPRPPTHLVPRVRDVGQSRRVSAVWSPRLRETDRHFPASARWLSRRLVPQSSAFVRA